MVRRVRLETVVFILPALLIIFFFMFLPMLESLSESFHSNDGKGTFVGLRNYIEIFHDPRFSQPFRLENRTAAVWCVDK